MGDGKRRRYVLTAGIAVMLLTMSLSACVPKQGDTESTASAIQTEASPSSAAEPPTNADGTGGASVTVPSGTAADGVTTAVGEVSRTPAAGESVKTQGQTTGSTAAQEGSAKITTTGSTAAQEGSQQVTTTATHGTTTENDQVRQSLPAGFVPI